MGSLFTYLIHGLINLCCELCASRDIQLFIDADWVGSLVDRRSISGYCTFLWGNLVAWRSKKKNVVSRSSVETELRASTLGTYEGRGLRMFVEELVLEVGHVKEFYDNNVTISIVHNPVHHDMIKHVEIDDQTC